MASTGSAFVTIRKSSVSSDELDLKTTTHFPSSQSSFSASTLLPWWAAEDESNLIKSPVWTWRNLQNHRLPSMYRFASYPNISDDEKPTQSYIGLIAEAILSSHEGKLILSDIYGFILANYPYFRNKGTGWRNSVRHNLSLNDCFIKGGRSQNGKGHYWAINPLYLDDYRRGDFRRKRSYKRSNRVKKARRAKSTALEKNRESSCHAHQGSKLPYEMKTLNNRESNGNSVLDDETRIVEKGQRNQSMDEPNEKSIFIEKVRLPAQKVVLTHRLEKVVPSPNWVSDESQGAVISAANFKKVNTSSNFESLKDLEEKDSRGRRDKTRPSRSFDMDRLLSPEGSAKNIGMMYPMYYNITSIGTRNLHPFGCYGVPPPFCSHYCSIGSVYSSPNKESMRLYPPVPQPCYDKVLFNNEYQCMGLKREERR